MPTSRSAGGKGSERTTRPPDAMTRPSHHWLDKIRKASVGVAWLLFRLVAERIGELLDGRCRSGA